MPQYECHQQSILQGRLSTELTGVEKVAHSQVAEGHPHDPSFVQVGGDAAGQGQRVGELVEHLSLLAPPTASRITQTHLPLLRARPG